MEKQEKKFYKKWWFWVIVIILIIGILGGNKGSTPSDNNDAIETSHTGTLESITFLKGSNGKDFFNTLCEIGEIPKKDGVSMGDSIVYASSNEKYGIELETNKDNEINWISIYTLLKDKNEYENFFVAISRLEYDGSDKTTTFNWIHDNLGNETKTKIGDVNLKLSNGTSGTPILEVYTDGNEEFQKQQLDKISN